MNRPRLLFFSFPATIKQVDVLSMKYFAEFHDAHFSRVETSLESVDLKISHMSVFCDMGTAKCDVFSGKGLLRLLGALDTGSAPGAGEILDVEGIPNVVELAAEGSSLRRQFPITLVTFCLDDGSRWAVRGTQAMLELRLEGPPFEEWDGSLGEQGSQGAVLRLP